MGENLINKTSSRSHCVYKIDICYNENIKPVSVYLIDLAGVERNKATFEQTISKKQFKESKNINLSLSTLLRCFKALKRNEFLPYRESTLTKIIFENMKNNIRIGFMINFDPNHIYFQDNIRVLEFSALAKNIKPNVLKTNVSFKDLKQRKKIYENNNSFFNNEPLIDEKKRKKVEEYYRIYFQGVI